MVVVPSDALNRSAIRTVVCVPLTTNLKWAPALANVVLSKRVTGLGNESVANVSQILSVDRRSLTDRVGKLPDRKLQLVLLGVGVILGK
jgi:mRNA interferase MazF